MREGETGAGLGARRQRPRARDGGTRARTSSTRSSTPPRRPITSRPATASTSSGSSASAPIPSIDIRNQCSGFVYALSVADAFIRAGQFRHVLVVGAEIQSTGDGHHHRGTEHRRHLRRRRRRGGARARAKDERGILAFDLHGDGTHAEKLWVDAPGSMYHPRISHEPDRGRGATSWRWTARRSSATRSRGCRNRCARCSPRPGTPPRTQPARGAPGQPPHRRDDAEGARAPGRAGLQQHHVVRKHHRRDDPDRAGRVRAEWDGSARGSRRDDGVRIGFLWGSAVVRW